MESESHDRFKTWMGVMVAIVALITALAAWRAAVSSRQSAQEDYRAVVSVLKAQETQTLIFANAFAHLTAFTEFILHADHFLQLSRPAAGETTSEQAVRDAQRTESERLADTNRNFFPARFANQDGTYDLRREQAELYADAARVFDLVPEEHLETAASLDAKTIAFIQSIIVASFALFAFTLAGALHPARPWLRGAAAFAGIVLLIITCTMIVVTEFS